MGLLKFLFRYGVAFVKWFVSADNRSVGIRIIKKGLDILSEISNFTKTTKDDKAALYLAKKFEEGVRINRIIDSSKLAKNITEISKGSLKDVSIGTGGGKINAYIGDFGAEWNPVDGSARFVIRK